MSNKYCVPKNVNEKKTFYTQRIRENWAMSCYGYFVNLYQRENKKKYKYALFVIFRMNF